MGGCLLPCRTQPHSLMPLLCPSCLPKPGHPSTQPGQSSRAGVLAAGPGAAIPPPCSCPEALAGRGWHAELVSPKPSPSRREAIGSTEGLVHPRTVVLPSARHHSCPRRRVQHGGEPLRAGRRERWAVAHAAAPLLQQGTWAPAAPCAWGSCPARREQAALALLSSSSAPWERLWREGGGGFQPLGMGAVEQTAGCRGRLSLRTTLGGCRNALHAVSLPVSHLWCCWLGSDGDVRPALLTSPAAQRCLGHAQALSLLLCEPLGAWVWGRVCC